MFCCHTGIPPHVELYKKIDKMQLSIDQLPPVLLEGMSKVLEEKGVAAGNITKQILEDMIKGLLETVGLARGNTTSTRAANASDGGDLVHFYGGKFHMLPQSFEFPQIGAFGAWKMWWFGDKAQGYPPLKRIRSLDLPNDGLKKKFSDWSVLMQHITSAIETAGVDIPVEMTEEKAAELFYVGMAHLPLAPTSRKRRIAELSLSTTLRLVRQAKQVDEQPNNKKKSRSL